MRLEVDLGLSERADLILCALRVCRTTGSLETTHGFIGYCRNWWVDGVHCGVCGLKIWSFECVEFYMVICIPRVRERSTPYELHVIDKPLVIDGS